MYDILHQSTGVRWLMRALFPGMLACILAALFTISIAHAAPLLSSTIILDASGGGCVAPFGSWDAGTKTCTLLSDINFTAEPAFSFAASDITLDGNGRTITPPGPGGFGGGIATNSFSGITIKNLTLNGFNYGFRMYSSSGCTIRDNFVSGGYAGIYFNNSASYSSSLGNIVTHNTIQGNLYGIMMGSYSHNNQVYQNSFIGNSWAQALIGDPTFSTGNIFNLAAPTGGNYFDNYDTPAEGCNDVNLDGFCDAAYVFSGGQDNLPYTISIWDTTAPTVAMSSAAPDPTNTSPIPVTVTFSESVTGFVAGDIVAGNGAVSNLAGSGASYTFDLTPAGQGTVSAEIAAGVATDAAGNPNTVAPQFSRTYDTVAPAVAMSSTVLNPTNSSPIPVTVTFSESVTGFIAGDIVVGNGAVSNLAGSGASYTFDLITPAGQGTVTADIAAGVATDAAGNPNTVAPQFSRTYDTAKSYYWTWYDNVHADNWVLAANPNSAAAAVFIDMSVAGAPQTLVDNGRVVPGGIITPKFAGLMGGPVKAISTTGGNTILSQRILWPKGGNSLEEVLATNETNLSDHYYWTWYDQQSPGYTDWVLIANPTNNPVTYQIMIAGDLMPTSPDNPGTIPANGKVTPTFPGTMDGPVEVTASDKVIASQRVLSGYGAAFNEVPGIPAGELSADYLWTWYDQHSPGMTDWVLIANPTNNPVTYQIKIGVELMDLGGGQTTGTIPAHGKVTPTFAGKMDGPVEVTSTGGNVIASQRVIAGPSFEEVPGYPTTALTTDYHWTWYDMKSAGATNWVLVANPTDTPVTYQIKIAGSAMPIGPSNPGTIPSHSKVTPLFPGTMNGPVEVTANGNVMVSQRVLWNGYFNEVLGTVLS